MSTKTLRKRIALVAVSALGFGILSAVPSNAAIIASPIGTVKTISLAKTSAATSGITSAVTVTASFTLAAIAAAADSRNVNFAGALISAPSNGQATVTAADGTLPTASAGAITQAATLNVQSFAYNATGASAADAAGTALFNFTPQVAGTYVLRVWHDVTGAAATGDGIYSVGETFQELTITVGTANSALSDFALSDSTTPGANGSLNGVRVSSVSATVIRPSGRVGVHGAFQPRFLLTRNAGATAANAGVSNATLSANLNYTVTNPAGTAVTLVGTIGSTTATTEQYVAGSSTAIADVGGLGAAQTAATHVAGDQMGSFVFFPTATAGTYTITVWHDQNRDDLVSPGEATAQSTVTVVADALPSIVMTVTGKTTPALSANGGQGQILKICLLNGTAAATLGVSETVTVSGDANTIFDNQSTMTTSGANAGLLGVTATNAATLAFTAANFDAKGCAYANVGNTTAGGGTYPLTAVIAGGTGAGATGSVNHSVVDTTTYAVAATSALYGGFGAAITNPNTPSVSGATSGVLGAAIAAADGARTAIWTIKRATAQTVTAKMVVGANASTSYTAVVNDTLGAITGWKGSSYGLISTTGTTVTAATAVTFSVAMPALSSSQTSAATLVVAGRDDTGDGASNTTITITNALAAATTTYINAAQDASTASVRAGVASSNKITGTVRDQFGNVLPNISVATAIVGRNAATVVPTLLSDANGQFSYTLADVYTGTLLTTDVVTMTPTGVTTAGAFTINYAAYLPAATVTLTTPDSASATATGIAGQVKTDIYSEGSLAGAEGGAVAVKAVLKDVNGATLPAGIPVTFSVAGTGVAILSTYVTVYTDASGAASTYVYGWTNGDRVLTATAGAVSASGTIYFRQGGTESETRTITAKATGNVVTATVTDRFGNPIKAASVTATRVGTGTFNGTSSITGTTDANGVVDFVLTNGTADVTVGFSSTTYGQTAATKGYIDGGITAILANTAGTTTLAEAGVGASFDAAGVNSAKVLAVTDTATLDQATAATDAAAEATDAANAATDAANAAAEAADAATAAAQDAADAVAALSTQVTELVSALRKQITSLTNLVIKIQKKVRA
jgi:hypothetical protein